MGTEFICCSTDGKFSTVGMQINSSVFLKDAEKNTYPPPADRPCVLFLCKSGCSANEPAAQAGRGALQPIGNCTKCKVLKGSAARLHGGAQSGRGRRSGEVPGFIGRKLLKRGFRCVFKNAHDHFRAGIDGVR